MRFLSNKNINPINEFIVKLQNLTFAFSFLFALLYLIIHFFILDNSIQSLIATTICCILLFILFYLSKYKKRYRLSAILFLILTLIMFCVSWVIQSGIIGGNSFFFLMGITIYIILLPKNYQIYSVIITCSTLSLMFFLEYYEIIEIHYQLNANQIKITNCINLFISLILISYLFHITLKAYEEQKSINEAHISELEKSYNIKSLFVSNFSHELRTPLNGIIGISQLLVEITKDKEQLDYLESINQSGEDLLEIINNTLNYSKIEFGTTSLNLSKFHIRNKLIEIIQPYSKLSTKPNINFKIDFPTNLPEYVIADFHKIEIILKNILGNAFKFTEKGSINLKLHYNNIDDSKTRYHFLIEDTGIGIDENLLNQIHKPFNSFNKSKLKLNKGIGLGLTLSKHYINMMNGKIQINSKINVGTKVNFYIELQNDNLD